jgi:subtilisin family serine protease
MKLWTRGLFALFILFAAACSVETQKGRENFDSAHLPPELAKLANQTLELRPLKAQILSRVEQDKNLFTFPVAVIDNGVDLAHPDLVDKYTFRTENGEITGVGHDFMGDDEFSSSVLINPEVFAFSAQEVKNGLILLGNQNPFEKMIALDKKISRAVLEKIRANPVLAQSVFQKLSIQSFNAFGLFRFLNDETTKSLFNQQSYDDLKTEDKLLTVNFREKAILNEILAKNYDLMTVYYYLDYPTHQLDAGSGLSSLMNSLSMIEHGDLLFQTIKDTLNAMSETQELKEGIERLVEFRLQRDHTPAPDKVAELNSAAQFLSKALEYHKQGISAFDPVLDFRWATIAAELTALDLTRKVQVFPTLTVTPNFVAEQISNAELRSAEYRSLLNQLPLSAQEKFTLRGYDRQYKKTKAMAKAYLVERGEDLPKIFDADYHSRYTSMLRKYFHRNKHPYYSDLSESEVHGTHVSGIIAKQNDALRIYPVRVTTRSALLTKTEYVRMVQRYKDEFTTWLRTPIVAKAIFTKFTKMLPANTPEPQTDADRLAFAALLMETMNEAIDMAFESGSLDFIFFDELKQALRHVGEKKIKIANISLGSEQNNPIPSLKDLDPEKDLPAVFSFLNFEFVKFQIGEILSSVSKDTLFVVAAGNSSTWVDGISHSALPVDVTSRFFAPFENQREMTAPNNHLRNVLGVGSLSPDEDLSGFTNVILGMKTPMIFAVGEKILSPIKQTDLSPVLTLISSEIPFITGEMAISPGDQRFVDKYKELHPEMKEDDKADSKISGYFLRSLMTLDQAVNSYSTELAIRFNDHREYLSGTSMATPAVVGTIGDQIIQRAQALGLKPEEVYDHPEMTPALLIKRLVDSGSPLFPETPEYPFKKVDVRGKYEHGEKVQKLQEKLKEILQAG